MNILSIETSCDETALALIEARDNNTFKVIGDVLVSQAEKHAEYGGVYPSLAKREHAKNLIPLFKRLLKETNTEKPANKIINDNTKKEIESILEREPGLADAFFSYIPTIQKPDIDIICVTQGPGLEPALWVGVNFAKALSVYWDISLVPVNHMEGHIFSVFIQKDTNTYHTLPDIPFPAISLLISGGHTQLIEMENWFDYTIIGETRDDAVGEAFDKVARLLGFPYPGGPYIGKLAEERREKEENKDVFQLPRPMIHTNDYNFSFSGLKTAVLYKVQEKKTLTNDEKEILAREFEDAVIDVLCAKTKKALIDTNANTLIVGGGVIASRAIRENLKTLCDNLGVSLYIPAMNLSGDNAVMIGIVGYLHKDRQSAKDFCANGNLRLGT